MVPEPAALSDEPCPHAARHRLGPARAAQVLVQYLVRQQQQVLAARQAGAAQERLRTPRGRKCAVAYANVSVSARMVHWLVRSRLINTLRNGCFKNCSNFWEFLLYNFITYSDHMHPHTFLQKLVARVEPTLPQLPPSSRDGNRRQPSIQYSNSDLGSGPSLGPSLAPSLGPSLLPQLPGEGLTRQPTYASSREVYNKERCAVVVETVTPKRSRVVQQSCLVSC